MAVLMSAQAHGLTEEIYGHMIGLLGDRLRSAPGFILHTAHRVEEGWRVLEIWESKDDANRFFAEHVAPNLPPGVRPKRSIVELHSLVR